MTVSDEDLDGVADDSPAEPTPEQYAERARRANLVVLLVPRAIAFTTGLGPVRTGICIGLAVIMIAAAGCTRRAWGIALGSGLQVAFLATGFLIATMFLVGAIFCAIWLRILMLRHEVVGTPGGLGMFTR